MVDDDDECFLTGYSKETFKRKIMRNMMIILMVLKHKA